MSKKSEESTRFYNRETLEIIDEVLRTTPKTLEDGTVLTHRAPTLADAKKDGYLPSVTSIIKAIVYPIALVKWGEGDIIRMAANYPYEGDCSEQDLVERYIPLIKAKRKEFSDTAKNKGKLIHKDKELFFMDGIEPESVEGKNIILCYQDFMKKHGANPEAFECEKPFGSAIIGYAGTPDGFMSDINIIEDLKTTTQKNFVKIKKSSHLYLSWKLQLGMYRKIAPGARLFQCVASYDTGEAKFIELEEPDLWATAAAGIFTTWCAQNGYDPRNAVAA